MGYPLSATTFVHVVDFDRAYFGSLPEAFNPLLPYHLENQEITLSKLPKFSEAQAYHRMAVRHSQVTKQPYLFEIDGRNGSVWCYRVSHPTPGVEFSVFNIMNEVGKIILEVDSSKDSDSDFTILCFLENKKELLQLQVDLRRRELRSRTLPFPSTQVEKVMSAEMVTFYDGNRDYKAYDVVTEEVIPFPIAFDP